MVFLGIYPKIWKRIVLKRIQVNFCEHTETLIIAPQQIKIRQICGWPWKEATHNGVSFSGPLAFGLADWARAYFFKKKIVVCW